MRPKEHETSEAHEAKELRQLKDHETIAECTRCGYMRVVLDKKQQWETLDTWYYCRRCHYSGNASVQAHQIHKADDLGVRMRYASQTD